MHRLFFWSAKRTYKPVARVSPVRKPRTDPQKLPAGLPFPETPYQMKGGIHRVRAFFDGRYGNSIIEFAFWYWTFVIYVWGIKDLSEYLWLINLLMLQNFYQALSAATQSAVIKISTSIGNLIFNLYMILLEVTNEIVRDPEQSALSTALAFGSLISFNVYCLSRAIAAKRYGNLR